MRAQNRVIEHKPKCPLRTGAAVVALATKARVAAVLPRAPEVEIKEIMDLQSSLRCRNLSLVLPSKTTFLAIIPLLARMELCTCRSTSIHLLHMFLNFILTTSISVLLLGRCLLRLLAAMTPMIAAVSGLCTQRWRMVLDLVLQMAVCLRRGTMVVMYSGNRGDLGRMVVHPLDPDLMGKITDMRSTTEISMVSLDFGNLKTSSR